MLRSLVTEHDLLHLCVRTWLRQCLLDTHASDAAVAKNCGKYPCFVQKTCLYSPTDEWGIHMSVILRASRFASSNDPELARAVKLEWEAIMWNFFAISKCAQYGRYHSKCVSRALSMWKELGVRFHIADMNTDGTEEPDRDSGCGWLRCTRHEDTNSIPTMPLMRCSRCRTVCPLTAEPSFSTSHPSFRL